MKPFAPSTLSALALVWCAFSVDFAGNAAAIPQDAPASPPRAAAPPDPPNHPPAAARRPESRPTPRPEDVASPEALEAALSDVISGPAGQKRDWVRFRSLFHPGSRLITMPVGPDGGRRTVEVTPEGYEKRAATYLETEGFFEKGIARRTESFGAVAHVFSTYESRHKAADALPFARGVNSIQMMKTIDGWSITSLVWEEERPALPIPAELLPRK